METQEKLEIKSKNLEITLKEADIALKILLLEHWDFEKKNTEKSVLENINMLVFPFINKLKYCSLSENQNTLLNIIENNLSEIIKPFTIHMMKNTINLSPSEIRIAKMVKDGNTAKEIALILHISHNTVREHKSHIRRKLRLKRKKVNLKNHLQSIIQE